MHPLVHSEIKLTYNLFGKELEKQKAQKAVEQSTEKYCGVLLS